MIGVKALEEILRLIQFSTCIQGARPLNVIIIGPSGGGKSLLLVTNTAEKSSVLMDFTSESLLQYCDKNKPSYIVCPDLNIVVSHRPTVAGLTVAALLSITGEGVSKIPGIDGKIKFSLPEGFVCGIMTACTYDMYISKRGKWRQIGLLRRLLPVYFSYLPGTAASINHEISRGMVPNYKSSNGLKIPDRQIAVKISDEIAAKLNSLADITMPQLSWSYTTKVGERRTAQAVEYSFDMHLMFRTYAKCSAIERGETRVEEQDYARTMMLANFVRLDRPYQI